MSAILGLRDYQREANAELHRRWDAGDTRVPMVLATGLGKTVIFAHLIADWTAANKGKRVIVLVHTDELVQQAYKKIKDVAPHLNVGIVKAAQNDVLARVIVASVQSLRSAKRRAQIRQVGMIVVDECHHATANTYRTILEHFGALPPSNWGADVPDEGWRPTVRVVGFTATLARGDKQKLSDVWQECTFQRGIAFGIRRGYLLDVRGKRIVVPDLDLSTVKKSGGDYQDAALGDAMDAAFAPSIIARDYLRYAADRKGLAFWPLVVTAQHGADAFNEAGIPSAVVHGGTPKEERRLILKKLHAGDIQVVHNCGVLTEGFDEPTVSCVVNARPTQSAPLYQQMVGRGLRPDLSLPPEARGDCLVLDVVGVSRSHNLRTLIDLSERAPEDLEMGEDESLMELEDALDAMEEAEAEGGQITVEEYYGETASEDFDPLNRTGIGAWLRTDGGTYFLPFSRGKGHPGAYVLLSPGDEPNTYDVAWLSESPANPIPEGVGGVTEHRGLSLEMAVSWGEEVLEDLGGSTALILAGAGKRWRREPVSVPQQGWMRRRGLSCEGLTKGDVSDLMSTVAATNRIDPIINFMTMEA